MQTHVKVLGVLYLAVGGCMLLGALFPLTTRLLQTDEGGPGLDIFKQTQAEAS